MSEIKSENTIRSLYKSLSPIQALSSSIPAINTLITSCIIGRTLGQDALAAIGFVGPFNYIILLFANLFAAGSQLLCGKHLGEGSRDAVNKTFNITLSLCSVSGIFLAVISLFFPDSIASLLGSKGILHTMTSDYIRGYSVCCLFSVLLNSTLFFLQIDGAKIVATFCIVLQIVLNVLLNVLNAFVLHYGMFGVGLASSIASFVAFIVAMLYLVFNSKLFEFSASFLSISEAKNVVTYGLNSSLLFVWLFFRDRVFNSLAFTMGGVVLLSAFTVANNVSNALCCTLQEAMTGATNVIASVFVGEKDVDSLRSLPKVGLKIFRPFSFILYIVIFVMAKPIAIMFGAESSNIALYVLGIRVFNLWALTNAPKTITVSVYSALKRIKEGSIFTTLGIFVFPVSCMLVAKATGSTFLIFSYAFVAELLLLVVFKVYYAIKTHSFKILSAESIYIPRDFSVPKEDYLSMTVTDLKSATEASEAAVSFCKSKGLLEKNSFYYGLCIEEIAVDKVTNYFTKKTDALDITLIWDKKTLSILFRDSCQQFNPLEWLALHAQDNPERSIGLKMVTSVASEIKYSNNLGLNIITVSI